MQSAISCPYKVFGLNPSASMDEVKRAYRREVKKYHPDSTAAKSNPMAKTLFLRVQTAYEMIERGVTGPPPSAPASTKTRQRREPHVEDYTVDADLKRAYHGFYTNIKGKRWHLHPGVDNGDVYQVMPQIRLRVSIAREEGFYRDGRHLHLLSHKITWKQANTIGGQFRIPHPGFPEQGGLLFTVKEPITNGDDWIIYERGFPNYGEQDRGDFKVHFQVESKPIVSFNPFRSMAKGAKGWFKYLSTLPPAEQLALSVFMSLALTSFILLVSVVIATWH
jgi:DnaJ-class molecular chaperone